MLKYGLSLILPYFFVYRQNRVRIFQIRKNKDTILSIYGKIEIREIPYFGIFQAVYASTTYFQRYKFIIFFLKI